MSECDVCGDESAVYRSRFDMMVCLPCEKFWFENGHLPGHDESAELSTEEQKRRMVESWNESIEELLDSEGNLKQVSDNGGKAE